MLRSQTRRQPIATSARTASHAVTGAGIYDPRVALTGKRILITGGAGFIGTTLAKQLVDANEVIAVDNLHRDALSGTDLVEHPELPLRRGRRARPRSAHRARVGVHPHRPCRRDRGRRHRAREPGAHDARERDRHLQRARGGASRRATRSSASSSSRRARSSASTRSTSRRATSRPSARSARRAGRTRSRSSRASTWRTPTTPSSACPRSPCVPFNIYRPGPDRRRRDPRVHRGGARRTRPRDPRRRLADPRLVLRRRHGRGHAARARAPGRRRRELQHRQRTLGGHDLRPRDADQAAHAAARERSASCRSTTSTSSSGSRTCEKARALLGFEARVELDEGLERTIAWYRARLGAAA